MGASVRQIPVRGELRWCVDERGVNGRIRKLMPSKRAADEYAASLRRDGSSPWGDVPEDGRRILAQLYREAAAEGVTLDQVWREWRAGVRQASGAPRITLGDAVAECLLSKAKANLRPEYLERLRQCLEQFAAGREAVQFASLTSGDLEEWMDRQKSVESRATWRSRLSTLFSWGVRRGYVATNPVKSIEGVRREQKPPRILSVEECRQLLTVAREHRLGALHWVCLGLFAGIRPRELDRLNPSDVNLENSTVRIEAAASKVRERRIMPLEPVAVEWLKVAGKWKPMSKHQRAADVIDLRHRMNWPVWPHDILRHTAASYLLAHHQDAGKVALWLGNSAGVLMRHYRELVTVEEAKAWLALVPQ